MLGLTLWHQLDLIKSYIPIHHNMPPIKNISEVTEPLKNQILNGTVHTIEDMRVWLKTLGYSDTINEAAINFILREFVMSKVSSDSMMNADMVVELLRPQLEVTKEDIVPVIISWDCTIIVILLAQEMRLQRKFD